MNNTDSNEILNIDVFDTDTDRCKIRIIPLKDYISTYSKIINSAHRVPYNQIILFSDGSGTLRIDNIRIPYYSQMLIPIRSNQVQLLEKNNNADGYLIIFSDDFMSPDTDAIHSSEGLKIFSSYSSHPIFYLSNDDFENMVQLIKQLAFEVDDYHSIVNYEIARSILNAVILKIEQFINAEKPLPYTFDTDYKLFNSFKTELEHSFKSDRRVKTYADRLCITTKKLNHITNNFYGKNAKQVIEDRLILETKRLLMYTDLTIQEISTSLGIDDPTNLVKFFKRHTNFTPARYRQSYTN